MAQLSRVEAVAESAHATRRTTKGGRRPRQVRVAGKGSKTKDGPKQLPVQRPATGGHRVGTMS